MARVKMLFLESLLLLAHIVAATSAVVPTSTSLASAVLSRRNAAPSETLPVTMPTGYFTTTKLVIVDGVTNDHVTIPAKTIELTLPTCIQTVEPDKNGHVPPGTCGAIWDYYPSFVAALVLAALFGLILVLHIWQAVNYQKGWCWVIIMAAAWETLAFTFRAISSKKQQSSTIYLVFQIFILLAPLWVNAFIYMTFGRMIHFFHPSQSIIHIPAPTFAAVFVGLDIASFVIQLVGGSLAGPTAPLEDQLKAVHIYMGGIGLQEFFIIMFVGLCIVFQREMMALGGNAGWFHNLTKTTWGPLLCTLYFSLLMISIRIIYRLVEFSGGMGSENSLTTHEVYFYILEAGPMLLALLAFNIQHPGGVMTGPKSTMPGLIATIRESIAVRKGKLPLTDKSLDEEKLILSHKMQQPSLK